MNNAQLRLKVAERLNKLASSDYDNIECWQIAEAFNKGQLEWVRRQTLGVNARQTGEEGSKMALDDLQVLLTQVPLSLTPSAGHADTAPFPQDYLYFKRLAAQAESDCCPPRAMTVYLASEADVDVLLSDELRAPSLEWGETFCTLRAGRARLYTAGRFTLASATLHYYRSPRPVAFSGCVDLATGLVSQTDVACEFKDDVAELLVDECVAILAADTESMAQYQRARQSLAQNS
jgi:hypothetical protein